MSKAKFEKDMKYSQSKLKIIKKLVRKHIPTEEIVNIKESTKKRDMEEATDYVVTTNSVDISVRVIRPGAWKEYHNIILRKSRPSDVKTELDKLSEGMSDYYLYLWDSKNKKFEHFILFDLDKLRLESFFEALDNRNTIPCPDGTEVSPIDLEEIRNLDAVIAEGDGGQTKLEGVFNG